MTPGSLHRAALLAISLMLVAGCASSDPSESGRGGIETDEPADTRLTEDDHGDAGGEDGDAEVADGTTESVHVCWSATPPDDGALRFADTTDDAGLVEPLTGMYGHATAIADVNGDGWTDLFVAGFADRPVEDYQVRGADGPAPDRLLLGGESGFTVDEAFPGQLARTSGATFADLDGDGDLDLVATRNARGDDEIGRRTTVVYEREGDGWTVGDEFAADVGARSVAAVDLDGDGLVDLAIAGDRFGAGPSRLFRNEGNLEFGDATEAWGMPTDIEALALAVVDLDGDGWVDLVFSGDRRVLLGGDNGFTVVEQEVLEWNLFGEEDDPAGIAVGDLDGDGRPDLVVGQHFNSTTEDGREVPVRVFLNNSSEGSVDLVDVTDDVGSPRLWTKSPHVAAADIDNDGHVDIVTSAGTADGQPLVLHNTGEDTLRFETIGESGDGTYWVTGATDDFDHDGRLDVILVAWEPGSESPLFSNESGAGHWLEVAVSAADEVVTIETEGGDVLGRAWAQSTTGYAAGASPVVRFGLGDVDDPIVVRAGAGERSALIVDGHSSPHGC